MKKSNEWLCKVVIIGDSNTGKTSLLIRYVDNTYGEDHASTIGLDFRKKIVELEDGNIVNIQIWDTAGQDRFRSIATNYYRASNGFIVVFDITDPESFRRIDYWMNEISKRIENNSTTIILVGNKSDLEDERQVSRSEIERRADELKVEFIETSAKSGENVDELFERISRKCFNAKYMTKEQEERPEYIIPSPDAVKIEKCSC